MNAKTLQDDLLEILDLVGEMAICDDCPADERELADLAEQAGEVCRIKSVRTFSQAHLLTTDAGLVIKMPDGSEYQLTIVRSR